MTIHIHISYVRGHLTGFQGDLNPVVTSIRRLTYLDYSNIKGRKNIMMEARYQVCSSEPGRCSTDDDGLHAAPQPDY